MALTFKDLIQILIGEQRLFDNSTQLNGKALEEQSSPHSFQTQSRAKRTLSASLTHTPLVDDTGCDFGLPGKHGKSPRYHRGNSCY